MNQDILALIQENGHTFSKGQKKIASYILESYDKAAFMTASRLGKKVGVSESTVVRFAAELGFEGYPDMQRSLQKMIRNRLTTVQRIEVANDRLGGQDLLSMVLQSDIEKIRQTLEELDRDTLVTFVDRIEIGPKLYENGGHRVPARSNQPYRQSVRIFYKFIGELAENGEKSSAEEPA